MWKKMLLLAGALIVAGAVAPESTLRIFFYGGIIIVPVIAAYTFGVYWTFRGKTERVRPGRV